MKPISVEALTADTPINGKLPLEVVRANCSSCRLGTLQGAKSAVNQFTVFEITYFRRLPFNADPFFSEHFQYLIFFCSIGKNFICEKNIFFNSNLKCMGNFQI